MSLGVVLGVGLTTSAENFGARKEKAGQKFASLVNCKIGGVYKSLRSFGFCGPVIVTVAERESVQFEYNRELSRKREKQDPSVLFALLVPLGEIDRT